MAVTARSAESNSVQAKTPGACESTACSTAVVTAAGPTIPTGSDEGAAVTNGHAKITRIKLTMTVSMTVKRTIGFQNAIDLTAGGVTMRFPGSAGATAADEDFG
jgi:hypothetical protein